MQDNDPLKSVSDLTRSAKIVPEAARLAPIRGSAAPAISKPPLPQTGAAAAFDESALEKMLSKLNNHVQNLQRDLQFSVDKESGETIVKVVDTMTKEVIRQIPSEELLAISNRLRAATGILLTEQV